MLAWLHARDRDMASCERCPPRIQSQRACTQVPWSKERSYRAAIAAKKVRELLTSHLFPQYPPCDADCLRSFPKVDLHKNVSRSGQLSGTKRHLGTKG